MDIISFITRCKWSNSLIVEINKANCPNKVPIIAHKITNANLYVFVIIYYYYIMKKEILYWIYLFILFLGQMFNVFGSFISVPYKNITFWDSYMMSLPYIILQRIFTNIAIHYIHIFSFFTNNQIVLMILLMQFVITMGLNNIYLHNKNKISDYIGIIIIIIAYYISIYGVITSIQNTYSISDIFY
jgi:hypothetical protein